LNPLELSYMEINVGNDGNLSLDGNNDLFVGNDKDHPNNPTVNHLNIEKNGNVIRNRKSNNTNFTEGGSESRLVDYSLLQYPVVNDRRMSKAAKNNSSTDDSSAEEESMGIGIEMEVAKLTEEQKKEILNITRPPNQFFLYCEENRSILKKKNPNLAPKEITKLLSKTWKAFNDDEKKKYKDLAEERKKQFLEKYPNWHIIQKQKKKIN